MGFPSSALKRTSINYPVSQLDAIDKLMWKGIHNRLFLYESDAESFVLHDANLYDLVFIDAYDGDDIFPRKLWDPNSSFLKALQSQLHPKHGTVVVNLHADSDILNSDETISSHLDQILPMGQYVSQVCRAYKDMLLQASGNASDGKSNDSQGLAFTVTVPSLCNVSLVVCRGFGSGWMQASDRRVCIDKDTILNNLTCNARLVEDVLDLPFSCLQYIKKSRCMEEGLRRAFGTIERSPDPLRFSPTVAVRRPIRPLHVTVASANAHGLWVLAIKAAQPCYRGEPDWPP
ncbi:S-adenosyl-L-methionine-dependent methyltransferase superfamily protein [Cinnamomum micranthum f. kanehirae]|uniref:S-adenosyl-L-methionine-dependent methyltransferase superfamily protein n=1 Tax=Cinnamomum micranthum f. kanehirae TaxID=337451 RepID=A0A443P667_9MAGN|nr:S-adenosyl-L-methionine-dependent methyltransferase superfamily protein [Cinnamomum micranthum f. kanehirae]